jgi:hypothetical protein
VHLIGHWSFDHDKDIKIISSFPKLVYMRVETHHEPKDRKTPTEIYLYGQTEIDRVLRPSWSRYRCNPKPIPVAELVESLGTVIIADGGCLLPPASAVAEAWDQPKFQFGWDLEFESQTASAATTTTLQTCFDMLETVPAELRRNRCRDVTNDPNRWNFSHTTWQLKCYPPILDAFIDVVRILDCLQLWKSMELLTPIPP